MLTRFLRSIRFVVTGRWVDSLVQDLRFALRCFRFNAVFSWTAVLTLGLGIGAATSVLSIVDATLLRPLPFPASDRVVDVSGTDPRWPDRAFGIPRVQSDALRSSRLYESVADYDSWTTQYTLPRADGALVINGVGASPDFFRVFRVQPARGRAFGPDDENTDKPGVCVLTSSGVRRLFGGQRDVLGRTLSFVEAQVTVIGVMDDRFWYPMSPATKGSMGEPTPDFLVPYARRSKLEGPDSMHSVAARLKPGVAVRQAQSDAEAVARRHATPEPGGSASGISVQILQHRMATHARPTLLTLFGVAGCLLLICAVNISNLLLFRSQSRTREFAVRSTLGARRVRLFRQLLTEYLVLAVCGGLVGLYLTMATIDIFVSLLPKGLLLVSQIELDRRMFGIAAIVTLVTGMVAATGPAWLTTRADLSAAVKAGAQAIGRTPRWRSFASGLLVLETAVLLVLLAGGALLVNTLVRLKTIDVGFDPDRLWTATVLLPRSLYPDSPRVAQVVGRMEDTLRKLPGVASVGGADWGLLGGVCPGNQMTIDGRQRTERPQIRHVSTSYFTTVNMGLRSGRLWTADDETQQPSVAVINQAAARRYWPKEDPIGRRITVNSKWPVQIIGVVRDLREANEREAPGPSVYLPLNPASSRFFRLRTMVVRTSQARASLGRDIVKGLAGVDPRISVTVERADVALSTHRQDPRFYAVFVGLAAVFGLLLAAVGIAGIAAQGVTRRTKEIGVRLALGADISGVVAMVVRQVCAPVVIGTVIGGAGALATARVLTSFLYEVTPQDPLTHVAAAGLLLAIALMAAFLPARRAARINPVDALRAE
jgi:predicted permease